VAKNGRGGLGRGLSSLLGNPVDNIEPVQRTANRQTVSFSDTEEDVVTLNEPIKPPVAPGVAPEIKQIDERSNGEVYIRAYSEPVIEDIQPKIINEVSAEEEKITDEVSIDLVVPNPDQPRTNFKEEELEELKQSILHDGLLQPILVRSLPGGTYQIIAGERRWQASKLAGLKQVPIRIKEVDDEKALELALIENIQRSDLNPIEEAYGYKRLIDRKKITQADVAKLVSKGRSTIANALRLLELPESAQQMLYEDKITAGHARAILSIPTQEGKEALTKKLAEEKLTVREAENIARLLANRPKTNQTKREPVPASYKSVAKSLKGILSTNVKVKSVKGKNKIEIEFKDEDDLKRILETFSS
jgi:ParB family chromosome partitioning protein